MGDFVFLEGFDYYWDARTTPNGAQAQWVKGFLDQNLVAGRFGGYCFEQTRVGGTEDVYCDLPDGNITTGEVTIGFAFQVTNAVSRNLMVLMQAGGTTAQFSIYQNSDGSIAIRNGNGGTVLGTSAPGLLAINTWYYIEVSVDIDNSGSATVDLDGTQILTVSGVDTMGAANANVGRVMLPEPASSGTMRYDDIYVRDDLTRVGPRRIFYRRPLAAISGGDFNLTATSAYIYPLRVDDQATDTGSYVTGDTVSDEQFFNFEDLLKLAGSTVSTVSLICFARTDAGTGTLDPVMRSNGDETVGASWSLDTTFRFRRRIFSLDPDTAAAWSRVALAASEGGFRINALAGGAAEIRVSLIGYQCLIPINLYNVSGGHRYWRVVPTAINGGNRPGSYLIHLLSADGEYLKPVSLSGTGGTFGANRDWRYAQDGRKDTGYIADNSVGAGASYDLDFGGPVVPKTLMLGAQVFSTSESFNLFHVDYSDDGSTWTTLYTETTPQTGWTSTEVRMFTLPDLTPPATFGRRRQALVLN